jgi:hypothetical protein
VLRVDLQLRGHSTPEEKLVVLAFHEMDCAVCVKATSNVALYVNSPEKMAGAVLIKSGTYPFFPKDTVIQPDNLFAVEHSRIAPGVVIGCLPESFQADLVDAINNSITMAENRRQKLLLELQDPLAT